MVDRPSVEDTIKILVNSKTKYEDYHNVVYDDEAIDACVKLSDRYITDRLLPDKAIDVMDEVGARVHLKNINVPQNIVDLEKKIEDVKNEKNKVVKSQKFEEAASLRDTEKRLQEDLEKAKNDWEEESKHKRDRKSTRLNSSHQIISYAVFCLKKKNKRTNRQQRQH